MENYRNTRPLDYDNQDLFKITPLQLLDRAITRVKDNEEQYSGCLVLLRDSNSLTEYHISNLNHSQTLKLIAAYLAGTMRQCFLDEESLISIDVIVNKLDELAYTLKDTVQLNFYDPNNTLNPDNTKYQTEYFKVEEN
jgi:hypothetical protein